MGTNIFFDCQTNNKLQSFLYFIIFFFTIILLKYFFFSVVPHQNSNAPQEIKITKLLSSKAKYEISQNKIKLFSKKSCIFGL